jgi:hypothetical protein
MQTTVELPRAFSVREENEFFPVKHLLHRLNPRLCVTQIGLGLHVNGGHTVYWGLVHLEGQSVSKAEFEQALRDAGFDFTQPAPQLDYASVTT